MTKMPKEEAFDMISGLIAGLIDVQTVVALMACCDQKPTPQELAGVLLRIKRDVEPDHSQAFIQGREYPAAAIAFTIAGLTVSPAAEADPPDRKASFSVILGGLAGVATPAADKSTNPNGDGKNAPL